MKTEKHSSHPVTELPAFDVDLARSARVEAIRLFTPFIDSFPASYSSLKVAGALSLYNLKVNVAPTKKEEYRTILLERLRNLAKTETQTAIPENPLLTIGIEIETPTKPFATNKEMFTLKYAPFFDTVGIPRNSVNDDILLNYKPQTYWEFSPSPSCSAGVQQRIISELIQGGFIPHLTLSQKPQDIQQLLDDHLVSLHINLGIPSATDIDMAFWKKDPQNLGAALAASYTSPLRIERRKQKQALFAQRKSGILTHKTGNQALRQERIELKAMELRTALSYRALNTSQLLFASLFSSHSASPDPILNELWGETLKGIKSIFGYYFYSDIQMPIENNYELARFAGRGNAASEMRKFLERQARRVNSYISTTFTH